MLRFPKKGLRSHSKEEKRLWQWFSRYIRIRDSQNGMARCITCGKIDFPQNMDCGHFVKRDRWNVKYHEMNNNAQCPSCNRFQDGAQGMYALKIDKKWGAGTAEMLLSMGARKNKLNANDCSLLADEYREKAYKEAEKSGVDVWWKKGAI